MSKNQGNSKFSLHTLSVQHLLSIDSLREVILVYLWFPDLYQIALTCKELNEHIFSDRILAKEMYTFLQYRLGRRRRRSMEDDITQSLLHDYCAPEDGSVHSIWQHIYHSCIWPTHMIICQAKETTPRRNYALIETFLDGQIASSSHSMPATAVNTANKGALTSVAFPSSSIVYIGRTQGLDRSFIGNDYFPVCFHPRPISNHGSSTTNQGQSSNSNNSWWKFTTTSSSSSHPLSIHNPSHEHHTRAITAAAASTVNTAAIVGSVVKPNASLPFAKPIMTLSGGSSRCQLTTIMSRIAYYEITIHPIVPSLIPSLSSSSSSRMQPQPTMQPMMQQVGGDGLRPTVCIGICRPYRYDLFSLLPGWNENSYGFHGDDGLFFVGNSEEGIHLPQAHDVAERRTTKWWLHGDQEAELEVDAEVEADHRFGEGDIVGFGIVYPDPAYPADHDSGSSPEFIIEYERLKKYGGFILTNNGRLQAIHVHEVYWTEEEGEGSKEENDDSDEEDNEVGKLLDDEEDEERKRDEEEQIEDRLADKAKNSSAAAATSSAAPWPLKAIASAVLPHQPTSMQKLPKQQNKQHRHHALYDHAWYPCIGTDCYNPITANFGVSQPFSFDIQTFEQELYDNSIKYEDVAAVPVRNNAIIMSDDDTEQQTKLTTLYAIDRQQQQLQEQVKFASKAKVDKVNKYLWRWNTRRISSQPCRLFNDIYSPWRKEEDDLAQLLQTRLYCQPLLPVPGPSTASNGQQEAQLRSTQLKGRGSRPTDSSSSSTATMGVESSNQHQQQQQLSSQSQQHKHPYQHLLPAFYEYHLSTFESASLKQHTQEMLRQEELAAYLEEVEQEEELFDYMQTNHPHHTMVAGQAVLEQGGGGGQQPGMSMLGLGTIIPNQDIDEEDDGMDDDEDDDEGDENEEDASVVQLMHEVLDQMMGNGVDQEEEYEQQQEAAMPTTLSSSSSSAAQAAFAALSAAYNNSRHSLRPSQQQSVAEQQQSRLAASLLSSSRSGSTQTQTQSQAQADMEDYLLYLYQHQDHYLMHDDEDEDNDAEAEEDEEEEAGYEAGIEEVEEVDDEDFVLDDADEDDEEQVRQDEVDYAQMLMEEAEEQQEQQQGQGQGQMVGLRATNLRKKSSINNRLQTDLGEGIYRIEDIHRTSSPAAAPRTPGSAGRIIGSKRKNSSTNNQLAIPATTALTVAANKRGKKTTGAPEQQQATTAIANESEVVRMMEAYYQQWQAAWMKAMHPLPPTNDSSTAVLPASANSSSPLAVARQAWQAWLEKSRKKCQSVYEQMQAMRQQAAASNSNRSISSSSYSNNNNQLLTMQQQMYNTLRAMQEKMMKQAQAALSAATQQHAATTSYNSRGIQGIGHSESSLFYPEEEEEATTGASADDQEEEEKKAENNTLEMAAATNPIAPLAIMQELFQQMQAMMTVNTPTMSSSSSSVAATNEPDMVATGTSHTDVSLPRISLFPSIPTSLPSFPATLPSLPALPTSLPRLPTSLPRLPTAEERAYLQAEMGYHMMLLYMHMMSYAGTGADQVSSNVANLLNSEGLDSSESSRGSGHTTSSSHSAMNEEEEYDNSSNIGYDLFANIDATQELLRQEEKTSGQRQQEVDNSTQEARQQVSFTPYHSESLFLQPMLINQSHAQRKPAVDATFGLPHRNTAGSSDEAKATSNTYGPVVDDTDFDPLPSPQLVAAVSMMGAVIEEDEEDDEEDSRINTFGHICK